MAEGANRTFEDRIIEQFMEQLKTNFGSLIDEESIGGLTRKAIDKAFFTPKKIPNPKYNNYSGQPYEIDGPTVLVEMIRDELRPTFERVIREYVEENSDAIVKAIREGVTKGALSIIIQLIETGITQRLMNGDSYSLSSAISNALSKIPR